MKVFLAATTPIPPPPTSDPFYILCLKRTPSYHFLGGQKPDLGPTDARTDQLLIDNAGKYYDMLGTKEA